MNKTKYILDIIQYISSYSPNHFHNDIRTSILDWLGPITNNISHNIKFQKGGLKTGELIQEYKGYKFRVNIAKDANNIIITLLTFEKEPQDCSYVIIDRQRKIAILQNLSYYNKCTSPDLIKNKGGSTILKFILGFLKLNKNNLGITRIVLKDNSYKYCKHCTKTVSLSAMYFLLHGNTWYGSYGFRPYNERQNKSDDILLFDYNRNKKIIERLKLKDLNLSKYIEDAVKSNKSIDFDAKVLTNYINTNPNVLLRVFLTRIMTNYDKFCCLFAHISEIILAKSNLRDFYGHTFYLDI